MAMQEERFSLGENSNRMVTVTPFNANLKVHIRQFYVNGNGAMKASRIGITLSVEEFNELVKLIPKIKDSITEYKLQNIAPSPPPPLGVLPPPLIDPSLEKILSDLDSEEKLERYHQDLAADKYLHGPTIDREIRVIAHDDPTSLPSLESTDDDFQMKRKEKRKRTKESVKNVNKKIKTESGIFVGYAKLPSELKVTEKKENKIVKNDCIDEVDSVESMKEVERKLWLTHYDMLSKKLMDVVREKCTGCQMNEPNQLVHELCLMSSSEEQVNLCFGEVYKRVIWDEVLDNWYKKVLEMPINLNPETLAIFRETVIPKDFTYKNRLRKWLIESPTIEL